jgi:hypothetical protein
MRIACTRSSTYRTAGGLGWAHHDPGVYTEVSDFRRHLVQVSAGLDMDDDQVAARVGERRKMR